MSEKTIRQNLRENLYPADPFVTVPLWFGLKLYDELMPENLDQPSKSETNSIGQKNTGETLPKIEKTPTNQLPEEPQDAY